MSLRDPSATGATEAAPPGDRPGHPGSGRGRPFTVERVRHETKGVLRFAKETFSFARDYWGRFPRTCTVCGFDGRFRAFGRPPRYDAECPSCRSKERHRLLALALVEHPVIAGRDVLHFAAEPAVAALVRQAGPGRYVSADISRPADLRLDLEAIELPDASFDVVVASHVLEHVDEKRALAELHRILSPGGTLVLMVPIIEGWDETFEDPSITSERDRVRFYGQRDHVRMYGHDFPERVAAGGFRVESFGAVEPAVSEHALARGEKVFFAHRD